MTLLIDARSSKTHTAAKWLLDMLAVSWNRLPIKDALLQLPYNHAVCLEINGPFFKFVLHTCKAVYF